MLELRGILINVQNTALNGGKGSFVEYTDRWKREWKSISGIWRTCGSLRLNRAPFADITAQSFHEKLPRSLMPVVFCFAACEAYAAVCGCVFRHFCPTRTTNSGTHFFLTLKSPAFSGLSACVILISCILTQWMRLRFGCASPYLCESLGVRTRCYMPAAVAVQWILLIHPLDNKVDSACFFVVFFPARSC